MCQFYTVSNSHTTHLLTIHCGVCVFKVIWLFYYKEPRFRVGGSFTILVSESWKQSRYLAHKEESTSLSAWKHNTGAEQSIVVYCLRTCVLSSCLLSKPKGPRASHSTRHLVNGKFTDAQTTNIFRHRFVLTHCIPGASAGVRAWKDCGVA